MQSLREIRRRDEDERRIEARRLEDRGDLLGPVLDDHERVLRLYRPGFYS